MLSPDLVLITGWDKCLIFCLVLSSYMVLSCLMNCFLHYSEVYIKAFSKVTPLTLRQVKASNIGQLVKISGIVTRCSDVKPLMQVAVYTCEECGFEIYQVLISFRFRLWYVYMSNPCGQTSVASLVRVTPANLG
jgi:DNA replicative helicase MCM subunit Mcm2 (Cdc46/Mcm family)